MDEVKLPFILLMEKKTVDRVQNITLFFPGLFIHRKGGYSSRISVIHPSPRAPVHQSYHPLPTSQASLHTLDHSLVKRPVFGHPDRRQVRWKMSRISRLQICPNGKLTAGTWKSIVWKRKIIFQTSTSWWFQLNPPIWKNMRRSNLIMGQLVGGNT